MSKRHRDDGSAAVELDPNMLRDAQHKALTINLQRYKLCIDELEAKLHSTQRTNTSLTDVVSLLGRQLVAVRARRGLHARAPASPLRPLTPHAPPFHSLPRVPAPPSAAD